MEMLKVEINVPEKMLPFILLNDGDAQLKRNAMMLYPYIKDDTISHGKAAEILGINKIELIILYAKLGLSYLDESSDELENDLAAIRKVRETTV